MQKEVAFGKKLARFQREREFLNRIGDILENVKGQQIRIKGHMDNIPNRSKLKNKFPTNWELPAMRAINEVHYLHQEGRHLAKNPFSYRLLEVQTACCQ